MILHTLWFTLVTTMVRDTTAAVTGKTRIKCLHYPASSVACRDAPNISVKIYHASFDSITKL